MIVKNARYLLTAIGLISTAAAQQPIMYTQYTHDLTYINPAYSLIQGQGAINTILRRQWVGMDDAPTTFFLNGYIPIHQFGASAGINVMHDRLGPERFMDAGVFVAKSVRLSEKTYMGTALGVSIKRYELNASQYAPRDAVFRNDERETTGNLAIGLTLYEPDKFYVSVSVPRINFRFLEDAREGAEQYFRNNYYGAAAYLVNLGGGIKLKPAMLVAITPEQPVLADFAATAYLKDLVGFGVSYRTTDNLGFLGYVFIDRFRIGYTYQFGLHSHLASGRFSSATHEVGLGYCFGSAKRGGLL